MRYTFKNIFCLLLLVVSINTIAQNSKNNYQNKLDRYLNLGFKHLDDRKLDSAKFCLSKIDSLINFSALNSSNFYRKEVLAATLLIRENNAASAMQKLLKAQTYFKEQQDSANIGFTLTKIGLANYYLNRRLVMKENLYQALQYKKHLSKRTVTRIFQNLGTIDLEEGMINVNDSLVYNAIDSYIKAIKIYKAEKWFRDEALATSLLAECYNRLDNFDKALIIIDEAILLSKKVENKSQEGFALIKKASFLGNKKDYLTALKVIKIAKPIFLDLDDKLTYLYALLEEKKILFGLKRYEEATVIGDELYRVSIENYDTRFADKVAEMDAKYNTAEKEKEIAKQKANIAKQELKAKQRNYMLLGLLFLVIFIVAIGFFIYKQQKLKQQKLVEENKLKEQIAQVTLQNKLHEERLRISRDLHDNIGSQLSFIISSTDNMKHLSESTNKKLNRKLTAVSNFTKTTITELRDTIWALNKDAISFRDLKARLYNYIENAKLAQEQTTFNFNANLNSDFQFNSVQGVNIYRIVQEAINNVMKYAMATNVSLNISETDKSIILSIVDDGIGFELSKIQLGNGLENMKSRASTINATFNIVSNASFGTEIKLTLPKYSLV